MTIARILVVDDDEFVRGFMVRCLRHLGCEVLEASRPGIAKEVIRNTKIDLVFTDLEMPEASDGINFIKFLSLSFPEVKVVLNTSRSPEDVKEPFDFYIAKPFGPSDIEKSLKAVLS